MMNMKPLFVHSKILNKVIDKLNLSCIHRRTLTNFIKTKFFNL